MANIVPQVLTSESNAASPGADKVKFCMHNVVHRKRMPALPVQLHLTLSLCVF